jgi:hypothetical protein
MVREGLQWKSFLLPWAKRLERKARPASGHAQKRFGGGLPCMLWFNPDFEIKPYCNSQLLQTQAFA